MNIIDTAQMKMRKEAYRAYAELTEAFSEYDYNVDRKIAVEKIKYCLALHDGGYPLPSGRWGTPLAVALENHQFSSAKYLLDNKDELNIDVNSVSSNLGGEDPIGFADELAFALSYYDLESEKRALESIGELNPSQYEANFRNFNEEQFAIGILKIYASEYFANETLIKDDKVANGGVAR